MIKRTLDILIALVALFFLAVPFAIIIVLLRLTGEHNVLYLQDRIGLGGDIFKVFKFVTMRENSEFVGNKEITVRNDPRVLPVGRILRMTKLNELPQIVNVLKGDMSIVGWRPLTPRGFADYTNTVQEGITHLRPGITGIGSIIFRDEEAIMTQASEEGKEVQDCYREDIAPYKGAVEMWYRENQTFFLDMKIIFLTAFAIVSPGVKCQKFFASLPIAQSALVRKHISQAMDDSPPESVE